jgi:divalent metal cation (Fe/Co/Zn/Cd) transporter
MQANFKITTHDDIQNISKGFKVGAFVGVLAGIATAIYFQKNKWLFGIIGLGMGAYIGKEIGEAKSPQMNIIINSKK